MHARKNFAKRHILISNTSHLLFKLLLVLAIFIFAISLSSSSFECHQFLPFSFARTLFAVFLIFDIESSSSCFISTQFWQVKICRFYAVNTLIIEFKVDFERKNNILLKTISHFRQSGARREWHCVSS